MLRATVLAGARRGTGLTTTTATATVAATATTQTQPTLTLVLSPARCYTDDAAAAKSDIHKRIEAMVTGDDNKVVLFMKGNASAPQCGFSMRAIQVLNFYGVEGYKTYDVLLDGELREGIKEYSSWPTIPQLYLNGEFVGGSDVLLELHESNELTDLFEVNGVKYSLEANA